MANIAWRCAATFSLNDDTVRHKLKLSVPQETEPCITSIQYDFGKDIEIRHEPEIKGAFKALQQKGLKITDYKEDIPKPRKK